MNIERSRSLELKRSNMQRSLDSVSGTVVNGTVPDAFVFDHFDILFTRRLGDWLAALVAISYHG